MLMDSAWQDFNAFAKVRLAQIGLRKENQEIFTDPLDFRTAESVLSIVAPFNTNPPSHEIYTIEQHLMCLPFRDKACVVGRYYGPDDGA